VSRDCAEEASRNTAGEVGEDLARRGVPADRRVTITIEPANPHAEGWSDENIDRIIEEGRSAVQSQLG
jgi:hypothetical protein